MDLLIFEKEIQAKTVCGHFQHQKKGKYIQIHPDETYFPHGAIGVWCSGHILRLSEPQEYVKEWGEWNLNTLPMIPERFRYATAKGKGHYLKSIKQWVHHSSIHRIIHAGDAGREGQLIVDEVLRFVKNQKPTVRLWPKSLSKQAIQKALKQMKPNQHYQSLSQAAESRAESDWLIGLNSTRHLTLLLRERNLEHTFTAGRVQTPLLALITKRYYDIQNFQKQPFWQLQIDCQLDGKDVSYPATWNKGEESQLFDYEDALEVQEFLKDGKGVVDSVDVETKHQSAPPLYNLTDLQADANKLYNFSLEQTLSIAQSLYEKSIISYPRAEPRVVSQEEAKEFANILDLIQVNLPDYRSYFPIKEERIKSVMNDKRYVDDNGVDDHHALIPTEQVSSMQELSADEQRIYDLILRRFIGIHLEPLQQKTLKVVSFMEQQFFFYTTFKETIDKGWTAIQIQHQKKKQSNDEDMELDGLVEHIYEGKTIHVKQSRLKEGETKPKPYFTEGQLATVMENAYYYLDSEERNGFSKEQLSLGTVATRAEQSKNLKRRRYIEVKENKVYPTLKGRLLIHALEGTWLSSPLTTGKLEQQLDEIVEGKLSKSQLIQDTVQLVHRFIDETNQQAPQWQITDKVVHVLSQRGKKQKERKNVGKCPVCDGDIVDKGKFYGCTNYNSERGCNITFPKKLAKKDIPVDQVEKYFKYGETDVIQDFISSRTNQSFHAKLVWSEKKQDFTFEFIKK